MDLKKKIILGIGAIGIISSFHLYEFEKSTKAELERAGFSQVKPQIMVEYESLEQTVFETNRAIYENTSGIVELAQKSLEEFQTESKKYVDALTKLNALETPYQQAKVEWESQKETIDTKLDSAMSNDPLAATSKYAMWITLPVFFGYLGWDILKSWANRGFN